ncbi:hypothetical protein GOODEAATRI_026932, partial [Goodea atripinnis]
MESRRRGAPGSDEDFSFVSPVVKYLLFFFNFIFWETRQRNLFSSTLQDCMQSLYVGPVIRSISFRVISLVMVAIGVYARVVKHAEAALACLSVDPAMMLMVVGILMFIITFCGCVGSLRENICLLQT